MIKLVLLMAFLAALAFGFATLADMPGHVLLQWGDTEFRVTLITGLVALVAVVFVLVLLWNILSFVLRLPSLVGLANRMRRRAKGHQALSRGLVAVGAGDTRLAERHAREAQKLLGEQLDNAKKRFDAGTGQQFARSR